MHIYAYSAQPGKDLRQCPGKDLRQSPGKDLRQCPGKDLRQWDEWESVEWVGWVWVRAGPGPCPGRVQNTLSRRE